MRHASLLPLLLTLTASASVSLGQDITVTEIGINQGNQDDFNLFGPTNGIAAYAFGTAVCNIGNMPFSWNKNDKTGPIIGTQMYRLHQGRIEQLGYNFVKYAQCGIGQNLSHCSQNCQSTGSCDSLGISCADVYSANTNDGKFGGARWEVQPTTGEWPAGPPTGAVGNPALRGRIQAEVGKLALPEDIYICEAQYVSPHDQPLGRGRNNYGWRQVLVASDYELSSIGPTTPGQPAIFAWQAFNDDVLITEVPIEDEGGPDNHGWMFLGSRAIDLGGGLWRYEYALQNGNSDRAAGSLSVATPCDASFDALHPTFYGVRHHSGSPYSNEKWAYSSKPGQVKWETESFATDPNANAVRWGTMHSFTFSAFRPPVSGKVEIGIFKPGSPDKLFADAIVPGAEFVQYCAATPNSTNQPALIIGAGSDYLDQNDLSFSVTSLPNKSFGYFMMSQAQDFVPNFGGSQGNLCLGAPQLRFAKDVLDSRGNGSVSFTPDLTNLPQGTVFQPGETWNFQYWYRDRNPGPTSNTSPGLSITFCQ